MTFNKELFYCYNNTTNTEIFYFNNTNEFNKNQSKISCSTSIGFLPSWMGIVLFAIAILGLVVNLVYIFNLFNFNNKKEEKYRKKNTLKKMFSILPFFDIITSIYWIIQTWYFRNAEKINQNQYFCFYLSLLYIFLFSFDLSFVNCFLFHFRKIKSNPIDAVLKPAKNILTYICLSIFLGIIVVSLSYVFGNVGRSPMITCFVNTDLPPVKYIHLILPVLCMIYAIHQAIIGICRSEMFTVDKKIRKLYKKNAYYVLIFCIMHLPLILFMIASSIIDTNEIKSTYYKVSSAISVILSCLSPSIISLFRLLQGFARIDCLHMYFKKKRALSRVNLKNYGPILNKELTLSATKEDPFDYLEKRSMTFLMRDVLIGISTAIKNDIKLAKNIYVSDKDYLGFSEYDVDITNNIIDDYSIEESGYLDLHVVEYAPKVFTYLRILEDIDLEEMINSFLPMNNTNGIKESQGKSGSFFISTDDNKYMIKTLKTDEFELIRSSFLKKYTNHISNNKDSLMCRIYGMYNIILSQGSEILIIVMRNIIGDFRENVVCKYDLKGSRVNRKSVTKNINDIEKAVMKDINFDEYEKVLMISKHSQRKLNKICQIDSNFLCSLEIMDYSLFVVKLTMSQDEVKDIFGDNIQERQEKALNSILIDSGRTSIESSDKRNSHLGAGDIHDIKFYKQYLYPSLNCGIVYLVSIIDFLQYYNFFKLVENTYKSALQRGKSREEISCVEPKIYSERFLQFINKITDVKQVLKNDSSSNEVDDNENIENDVNNIDNVLKIDENIDNNKQKRKDNSNDDSEIRDNSNHPLYNDYIDDNDDINE